MKKNTYSIMLIFHSKSSVGLGLLHVGIDQLGDEAREDQGHGPPLDQGDVVAVPQHTGQDGEELPRRRHRRARQ